MCIPRCRQRLEPLVQRSRLGIHHHDAVITDDDQDIAAAVQAFEHVSLAPQVCGLDLRERKFGLLRLRGAGRKHRRRGQLYQSARRLIRSSVQIMAMVTTRRLRIVEHQTGQA